MNNLNIYISLGAFVIAMIISNIVVYNIGIKDGKRIYKDMLINKSKESIQQGVKEGKYLKKLPDNHTEIITRWVNGEITSKEASYELGISNSTLYKRFGFLRKAVK